MFELDDWADLLKAAGNVASELEDKAIEVAKEEAPHFLHKAGEVIEEIIRHK